MKDVPGFYVNRCLGPYLVETSALIEVRGGWSPAQLLQWACPCPTMTLADAKKQSPEAVGRGVPCACIVPPFHTHISCFFHP